MKILMLIASFLISVQCAFLVFLDSESWISEEIPMNFDLLEAIGRGENGYLNSKVKRVFVPTQKNNFLKFLNIVCSSPCLSTLNSLEPTCRKAFSQLLNEISSKNLKLTLDLFNKEDFQEQEIGQIIREWYFTFSNVIHIHAGRRDVIVKQADWKERCIVRCFASGELFIRIINTMKLMNINEIFTCSSSSAANVKIISQKQNTGTEIGRFYVGPIENSLDFTTIGEKRIKFENFGEIFDAFQFAFGKTKNHKPNGGGRIENYVFWRGEKVVCAVQLLILDCFPFQNVKHAALELLDYFPLDRERLIGLKCIEAYELLAEVGEEEELVDVEVLSDVEARFPTESNNCKMKAENVLLCDEFVDFINGQIEQVNRKERQTGSTNNFEINLP
jgi:hypothetical protein